MAWGYRKDRKDEVFAAGSTGPAKVPYQPTVLTAAGAIDPDSGLVVLQGSGTAMTLVAPTENGQWLSIISDAATAFVITPTGGIQDGVTGGSKTAATFAAFKGASIELRGFNGSWYVISKNVATVA